MAKSGKTKCSEITESGELCKLSAQANGKCHIHNRRNGKRNPKVAVLEQWRRSKLEQIEQGVDGLNPEELLVEALLWARSVRDGEILDYRNTNTTIEEFPASMKDRIQANAEVRRTLQFILDLPGGGEDTGREEVQARVRRLLGA